MYKIDQTPDRQCICDEYENFRLVRRTLNRLGIKGVPVHSKECIEMSLCKVDDNNADSNESDADSDTCHQIDPNYGRIECINRSCKQCGKNLVLLTILKANPNVESNVKLVEYSQWCWQKKNAKTRTLVLEKKNGTVVDIITLFAAQLDALAYHIFSCNWNYAQFQHVRDNLKPGLLLQVYDFGQNFMNVYQDESQAVHWDHTQTTIHPIISYYIKPGESTITTEEHIMVSDDLNHDKFAVRKFKELSLKHLKSKGLSPRFLVIFSDNCKRQYKGKGTFQFHSESDVPLIHMFCSARHGKGPADGAVGRVKHAAWRAIKSRQVIIKKAEDFYQFCFSKFGNNEDGHFIQKFFYVPLMTIDRNFDEITAGMTKGSDSWYSVRSTGTELVLEVQQVGCCCDSCLLSDGSTCPNQAYSSQWIVYNLVTGKPLMDTSFKNKHWNITDSNDDSNDDCNADCNGKTSCPSKCLSSCMKVETHNELSPELVLSDQWRQILKIMHSYPTYSKVETYVFSLNPQHSATTKCSVEKFR